MTFEEYESLALNPPKYNGTSIFRIDTYCYVVENCVCGEDYELHLRNSAFYLSLEDAETALSSIKKSVETDELKIFCHFVYELPTEKNTWFDKYLSIRRYDEKGNLSERTLCEYNMDESELQEFRGREDKDIHFKPGDFVEVMGIGIETPPTIGPAIIKDTPKSIEKCWELKKELPQGFTLNWIDDNYKVLDAPLNEMWDNSIHPVFVFKPRNEFSESLKEELRQYAAEDTTNLRMQYCREGGSEKDLMAIMVAGFGLDYNPCGPIFSPEDFLPIYGAKEVNHITLHLDCDRDKLFEFLEKSLSELKTKSSEVYNGFLINIIEPDRKDKHLQMTKISKWRKYMFKVYCNICTLKLRQMISPKNNGYQIEILAYKL